jgi:(Z)-2-((N-methylformamido)methylene)-5-hydroxybutyrolactone dehydrogenase
MLDKIDQPAALQAYGMYINGESIVASNGRTMESLNPYSGKPWATVPDGSADDINRAVAAARKAFDSGPWSQMTATQRAALLRRLGDIIKRDAEDLARCESRDNGKLYGEMLGQ